jgi:hypothetical protein
VLIVGSGTRLDAPHRRATVSGTGKIEAKERTGSVRTGIGGRNELA